MTNETRDYLQEVLERAVPELSNFEQFDISLASARFWDELSNDAASGDDRTQPLLDVIGRAGARAIIEREKRRIASGIIIRRRTDGTVEKRKNQGFRATQRQAPDGTRYFQQGIWWKFNYEDLVALVQAVDSVWIGMGEKRAGLRRVLDAYEQHRNALTAEDACRLAGFDIREIEVTDDDIRRVRAS